MSSTGKLLCLLLSSFCPLFAFSQEIAPYSRYGLGEVSNSVFSASRGMGGLAASYRDRYHINLLNPASYAHLSLTTFEGGLNFITKNIRDGATNTNYRTGDGFFDYMALAFPIGKGGAGVGLMPYSKMRYDFNSQATDSSSNSFEGSGRTYNFFVGGAYQFQKSDTCPNRLSLGLNASYFFGPMTRMHSYEFENNAYYNSFMNSDAKMSNFALNVGLQYTRILTDKLSLVSGAYSRFPVVSTSSSIETRGSYLTGALGQRVNADTTFQATIDRDGFKIPVESGVGISLVQLNKFNVGLEARHQKWSDVEGIASPDALKDAWELRTGIEIQPNYLSQRLVKRALYRLGAYYNTGYLEINGRSISEYGITFGFSIPVKSALSRLNFSFEAGNRGTVKDNLVSETFFRAYIGFTLNDKWFIKRQYD